MQKFGWFAKWIFIKYFFFSWRRSCNCFMSMCRSAFFLFRFHSNILFSGLKENFTTNSCHKWSSIIAFVAFGSSYRDQKPTAIAIGIKPKKNTEIALIAEGWMEWKIWRDRDKQHEAITAIIHCDDRNRRASVNERLIWKKCQRQTNDTKHTVLLVEEVDEYLEAKISMRHRR